MDDSSSPGASSCGLEMDGVAVGDTKTDDGVPELLAKFLNIARIESALDTLDLILARLLLVAAASKLLVCKRC